MDKQTKCGIGTSETLLSPKKENSDTYYNMDKLCHVKLARQKKGTNTV